MINKKQSFLTFFSAIALAIVIFVALSMVAFQWLERYRIDLTENKLYTLSEGTNSMLETLQEPIRLRFFYSDELANGYPALQSYANRIKGMLRQYETLAGGTLKVEFIHPKPFTEEEDLAVALGLTGAPIDNVGNKLYFGLSGTNSSDDRAAIPFFDPSKETYIEYDITRLIYELANINKTKVGILSWAPIQGGGGTMLDMKGPWAIYEQMKEAFDTEILDKENLRRIPRSVNILMIIHPPKTISEEVLYAIDQYILKGGKAFIFTDPHSKLEEVQAAESDLAPLFARWGIDMIDGEVVTDPKAAIRVRSDNQNSALSTIPNPTWLALEKPNFNQGELTTGNLELMRLVSPGHFLVNHKENKNPDLEFTPLILSNAGASTISHYKLMFNTDPSELMKDYKLYDERLVMAAHLNGKAKSAFPEKEGKVDGHLASSIEQFNIVVVADVDMLKDGLWVNRQRLFGKQILIPTASNGSFVLNTLDHLSGSRDLISLRSRTTSERRFEAVEAMRNEAEAKFRHREQQLQRELRELEDRLTELQQSNEQGGELLFSDAQEKEMDQFREKMVGIRKELRKVQRSLQENIEALGQKIKIINIILVPLFILLLAWVIPPRLGMKRR